MYEPKNRHDEFRRNMRVAGYAVFDHKNKPAIKCWENELPGVRRATSVPIAWEKLGFGIAVFPKY